MENLSVLPFKRDVQVGQRARLALIMALIKDLDGISDAQVELASLICSNPTLPIETMLQWVRRLSDSANPCERCPSKVMTII